MESSCAEKLRLVEPDRHYYASYLSAIREYEENSVERYPFLNPERYDIFDHIARYRTGTDLPPNRVPSTCLWLVDGDEFVGEISIRHGLTEALLQYGGHIGYGIRYSRWNQGCGTRMLSLALDYVREHFEFEKVLITCDDDNMGSARVIEKNGGVLQDKVQNHLENKTVLTRRYWIKLK